VKIAAPVVYLTHGENKTSKTRILLRNLTVSWNEGCIRQDENVRKRC